MDDDWRKCVNVKQHLYVMSMKAHISHVCSNAMLTLNGIAAILYLAGESASLIHFSKNYNNNTFQFPIKVKFPFETEQSPIFELLFVSLSIHMTCSSLTVGVINSLISTLVGLWIFRLLLILLCCLFILLR